MHIEDSVAVGGNNLVLNELGMRFATVRNVKPYVAGPYPSRKSNIDSRIAAANEPWQIQPKLIQDANALDVRELLDHDSKKSAGTDFATLKARIDSLKSKIVDTLPGGGYLSYSYNPASGIVGNISADVRHANAGRRFCGDTGADVDRPGAPNEELKLGLPGSVRQ